MFFILLYAYICLIRCIVYSNKERGYVVYINLLGSLEPRI